MRNTMQRIAFIGFISGCALAASAQTSISNDGLMKAVDVTLSLPSQLSSEHPLVIAKMSDSGATGLVVVLDGSRVVGSGDLQAGSVPIELVAGEVPGPQLWAVYLGDAEHLPSSTHQPSAEAAGLARFGSSSQAPMVMSTVPSEEHKKFATYTVTMPDVSANGTMLFVLNGQFVGSDLVVNGSASVVRGIGTMHVIYTGDAKHLPSAL